MYSVVLTIHHPDIKCGVSGCGEARNLPDKSNEYLAYCLNRRFRVPPDPVQYKI